MTCGRVIEGLTRCGRAFGTGRMKSRWYHLANNTHFSLRSQGIIISPPQWSAASCTPPERPLRPCNWQTGAANSHTRCSQPESELPLGFAVRSSELVRLELARHKSRLSEEEGREIDKREAKARAAARKGHH